MNDFNFGVGSGRVSIPSCQVRPLHDPFKRMVSRVSSVHCHALTTLVEPASSLHNHAHTSTSLCSRLVSIFTRSVVTGSATPHRLYFPVELFGRKFERGAYWAKVNRKSVKPSETVRQSEKRGSHNCRSRWHKVRCPGPQLMLVSLSSAISRPRVSVCTLSLSLAASPLCSQFSRSPLRALKRLCRMLSATAGAVPRPTGATVAVGGKKTQFLSESFSSGKEEESLCVAYSTNILLQM